MRLIWSASVGQTSQPLAGPTRTRGTLSGWNPSCSIISTSPTSLTMFCHDWGGLLGLRLVADYPERFARVIAANTFLPTGDRPPGGDFLSWREFGQTGPDLPIGKIVNGASLTDLSPEVIAAYDAPFPDERFRPGHGNFQFSSQLRRTTRRAGPTRRLGTTLHAMTNHSSRSSAIPTR